MQAKLFSVYDAAAAAEDALALVQQQLTLTLNRNYYEADEIESMAAELDCAAHAGITGPLRGGPRLRGLTWAPAGRAELGRPGRGHRPSGKPDRAGYTM